MDNQVRSFIAIDPPASLLPFLTEYAENLRREHTQGFRWVNPQLFHLTLKFLGDISINKIESVTNALNSLTGRTEPFDLILDRTGAFPSWQSPRTIWIGSPYNEAINHISIELENELKSLGIPVENKRFHAHLTLCRVVDHGDKDKIKFLENKMKDLAIPTKLNWRVTEIKLYRSILSYKGSAYSIISTHKFKPLDKV